MIQFPDIPLPTLDRAGISSLPAIDTLKAHSIAQDWLTSFAAACSNADTQRVLDLLHPSTPFWRDMLALTWDFRTIFTRSKIADLLSARLADTKLSGFTLNETYTGFQQPFPDLAWINLVFNFHTKIGNCTGVTRLVPLPKTDGRDGIEGLEDLEWKAHVVYTNLDSLTNFPEKTGPLRDFEPSHRQWTAKREVAGEFAGAEEDESKNPVVLLIGAGQSGLSIAARLKALDVPALVIDKNERIGDSWRGRYDSLNLHDTVWYDHMPYLPFPPTWPVYCPSHKLAKWLEHYADALDLDVWTSSIITSLNQDIKTHKWHITILRRTNAAGQIVTQERKLVVKHIIFCTGFGSPNPPIPSYPGLDTFQGEILHSTGYKRASDHQGKKVLVVGACTSGHDIAMDCHDHGIDITMFQRNSTYITSEKSIREVALKAYSEDGPPVEIADRLGASFTLFSSSEVIRRTTRYIAALDKDLLEPLHKVGFRTNLGYDDTGIFPMVLHKCGGYYFNGGASDLISEGKIKLKNDSKISHFTERTIVFDNESELEADVVIFATGIGETKEKVATILSASNDPANGVDELITKIKPIWGINDEGEINGVYTYTALGVPGLWYMLGNLAMCRFHSTHIALQIKAMEEGIWNGVYQG